MSDTSKNSTSEKTPKTEVVYADIFEHMSEMFQVLELIYDEHDKVVDYYYRQVNPAFEKLVAMSSGDIIGKRVNDLFGVVEKHWLDVYEEVDKTGKTISTENYGEELDKYYEIKAWKMDTHLVACIFFDITERKQAEEELQENNKKYLNLMDSLGTGVILHASDTSIILSNPKASEILGISPEQMKGKKTIDPKWRFVRNDVKDMPLEEYPLHKALSIMKSF